MKPTNPLPSAYLLRHLRELAAHLDKAAENAAKGENTPKLQAPKMAGKR